MALDAAQALKWLAEMGADETILPQPIDRFAESEALKADAAASTSGSTGPALPRPALNRPQAAAPAVEAAAPRTPTAAVPAIPASELEAMAHCSRPPLRQGRHE